jgi:hypothetical protein
MGDQRVLRSARRRRLALLVTAAVAVVGSSLPLFASTTHASVGAPVHAGAVVVVDPSDPTKALSHGGSATKFTLRVPASATCPGDSAHDQWRVQSFLVPVNDDPAKLVYGLVTPDGDGRWSLVDGETHPFINALTLANSVAGEPGQIPNMPTFSFVLFPPGTLPDGRYRVGIACTYFAKTAKYWETELVIASSPNDRPGQLVWSTADVPLPSTTVHGSGSSIAQWAAVGAGVCAVAALTLAFRQRNARRTRSLVKEHS